MIKLTSPTHPEINEIFCDKNKSKFCEFEKAVNKAIKYSIEYDTPAKYYINGIYSGIIPKIICNSRSPFGKKRRK